MTPAPRLIDPRSPAYQEFARLYRIARALRPGTGSGWNGQLYAINDDRWGAVEPKTHAISLHEERVLPYLTGHPSAHPEDQAQALQTVLHETFHLRVPTDAPNEPNAYRRPESKALDEGLADVVPPDRRHQRAARAELVMAMAHPSWHGIEDFPRVAGELAAYHTKASFKAAIEKIRQHYNLRPAHPVPSAPPNLAVLGLAGERARRGRLEAQAIDPAMYIALSGQPPAGLAVTYRPVRGNGSRRSADDAPPSRCPAEDGVRGRLPE